MNNKQKIFLTLVIFIIIVLAFAGSYFFLINRGSQPAPVIPTPDKIKILSYNINHGEGPAGGYGLKEIIEIIKRENPDFVTLNDVDNKAVRTYREDQARKIAGNLGMFFTFGKTTALEGGWNGNAILSRYPLIFAENRFYKDDTGDENQAFLHGVFRAGEKEIHIYTTELAGDAEIAEKQNQELIDHIVDEMAQNAVNDPLFLTGSFNLNYDHVGIKGMKNYFENTTVKSSFTDKLTWPAHSPKYQYDYIFSRKNASLGGVKIIRDNNTQNTSDHLPLIAEFELK